ncbi:MAG: transcription-repair coupling factor [Lentimicrobiaceae bacterium]|nr:transcription-repair coupling factor [Lentimicrobiaceae bacterium]
MQFSTELLELFRQSSGANLVKEFLVQPQHKHFRIEGLCGSAKASFSAACVPFFTQQQVFILPDKESAAFFYGDMEQLLSEEEVSFSERKTMFFPALCDCQTAHKKNSFDVLLRTKAVQRIYENSLMLLVTYPEAISEKIVERKTIETETFTISKGEKLTQDFLMEFLSENDFEYSDFVFQPGQYAIRGGIIDVFSYANDFPYRIEFSTDSIDSLRTFDPETQLSKSILNSIVITPDLRAKETVFSRVGFFESLPKNTVLWLDDVLACSETIKQLFENNTETQRIDEQTFKRSLVDFHTIEFGYKSGLKNELTIPFRQKPQLTYNRQFELLIDDWIANYEQGIATIFSSANENQAVRVRNILRDILHENPKYRSFGADYLHKLEKELMQHVVYTLHEGFVDEDLKIAFYTDHQIFERYHRYKMDDRFKRSESVLLKEIYELKQGDYITHIDHGVGQYAGLEKIEINGRQQESIKILYKGGDALYISIHSLHRIARYSGKEGTEPTLNRLGGHSWDKIKEKTKSKVKELVINLEKLYAERKTAKGYAFSPDSYLQSELEASFVYEDTPDQAKAVKDVKSDMEADFPMDRLVCGDVGFGKTEVAIRAAFKAVYDGKQVAVLVPTTVLALQHYNTFRDRFANFACKVDYINRFKSAKAQNQTLEHLKDGKIDIIIGTHRLLSKDVIFKDLGLLVIDEEQKFGVGAKEKLRTLKVNVDTLTMTATPIPRTLQFSLMGARDISIMRTPPQNRYPIQTELHQFSENLIKTAIEYELFRGGQVFFVHNRISNLAEIAGMIQRNFPDQRIAMAHGQMDGVKLEEIMMEFIDGNYNVLVSTAIVESGLDIPNANTIIINEAQNYGLSELHQLRGRVGRTNKKAFCYLLTPPVSVLPELAAKRLRAIEEFSDIGSGFNIAMRDLDIRGAGNILGAEQSGFIADIGYEMYQKILDEAIVELRENTMTVEEAEQDENHAFVRDCVIETDLELLLPDSYIASSTERYTLYKELNDLTTNEELENFQTKLTDRFGELPPQAEELLQSIVLRRTAQKIGFEKLILKQGKLVAYFLSNPQSPYFQGTQFTHILQLLQKQPHFGYLRENGNKFSLTISKVNNVRQAIEVLEKLKVEMNNEE